MAMVATAATTHTQTDPAVPQTKKKKTRSERKKAQREAAAAEKLKIIVRRLPPNLPEEIFWQSVQAWVTEETAMWRKFFKGKLTKKYNKENVPSRAYIAFRNIEQVATFSQAYDGHVFRDKAGNESIAIVEFAPSQKVPPEKKKADNRMGTIDQDEEYLAFVESLNALPKPSETDTIETLIAASKPAEQPSSTPLLDALKAEKQAYNDRQTILRAHAHYRDGDVGGKRRGKQPAIPVAPPAEAVAAPTAGQGKRRRGKKGGGGGETKVQEPAKPKEIIQHVPTKTVPPSKPAPAASTQASSLPPTPVLATVPVPEGPRRPRIVGVGGAQRQFAAALSGAGLGGGRRAASRKVVEEKVAGDAAGTPADAPKDNSSTPQAPGSPGRNRGGRRRGDSVKSQAGGVPNIKEGQISKSPLAGVLQLHPEVSKSTGIPPNEQIATIDPNGPPSLTQSARGGFGEGRGGKRGRIRSRGRGRGGGEAVS